MAKLGPILQKDEALLRKKALPVAVKDIGGKRIRSIIRAMKEALHAETDGVAIAAPQIGAGLRIFIVSGQWLARSKDAPENDALPDLVCINPEISKLSKKKRSMEEGCLSVRYLYGKVARAEKATITALDMEAKRFTRGGSGILAQIFQHEMDHLEGILFIDKATDIIDMPPEDREPAAPSATSHAA